MKTTEEKNRMIAEFMGFYGNPITKKGITSIAKDSKYHTSWDWLMPVVSKCLEVNERKCDIIREDGLQYACLKTTYSAVCEFIEWYNENKEK